MSTSKKYFYHQILKAKDVNKEVCKMYILMLICDCAVCQW